MSHFYGFDCFGPNVSKWYKRFWLEYGRKIIHEDQLLQSGMLDDDQLYELMKERFGEERAADALYLRKKARDDAKVRSEA